MEQLRAPLTIIIPAFNEASRMGETLRRTLDYLTAAAPESESIRWLPRFYPDC